MYLSGDLNTYLASWLCTLYRYEIISLLCISLWRYEHLPKPHGYVQVWNNIITMCISLEIWTPTQPHGYVQIRSCNNIFIDLKHLLRLILNNKHSLKTYLLRLHIIYYKKCSDLFNYYWAEIYKILFKEIYNLNKK